MISSSRKNRARDRPRLHRRTILWRCGTLDSPSPTRAMHEINTQCSRIMGWRNGMKKQTGYGRGVRKIKVGAKICTGTASTRRRMNARGNSKRDSTCVPIRQKKRGGGETTFQTFSGECYARLIREIVAARRCARFSSHNTVLSFIRRTSGGESTCARK